MTVQRISGRARGGPPTTNEQCRYADTIALLDALPMLTRAKRRRLGLTLEATSEASGVTGSTIKRIEDGTSDPSWKTVRKLLWWVGLPDYLSRPTKKG